MANLTNSFSLTDFQRNARTYIENINETHEPILLTVNGKVQAVLVDPVTYQQAEEQMERARFIAAIREGELAIQEGRTQPAEEVFAELDAKLFAATESASATLAFPATGRAAARLNARLPTEATDDPKVIAKAQEALDETKTSMNEERVRSGADPIF